jgi:acetyl-CoA acyltransferase
VPMTGWHYDPDPGLAGAWPGAFLSMGLTAEEVAARFGVDREAQDAWALRSHQRAAAAQAAGWFRDEVVPVTARTTVVEDGRPRVVGRVFEEDEGVRTDTDAARLAALRPAFRVGGTVTAGNSSQTSDGAAALVVMSGTRAAALGLTPLGRLVSYATVGVDPEIMGIGPVEAIPKALAAAGVSLHDIAVVELNEAFAAQVVEIVRRLGLDEARTNPNGGAIALGHPLGATGAKLSTQILSELARREARYGLVTMCVGGGQGAAGVIEWLGGRQTARPAAAGSAAAGSDSGSFTEAAS